MTTTSHHWYCNKWMDCSWWKLRMTLNVEKRTHTQNIDEKQPENLNGKEKQTLNILQYNIWKENRERKEEKKRITVIYRYKPAFTSMIQMFLDSRQFVCATKQSGKRCLKLVRNVMNHSIPCLCISYILRCVYIYTHYLSIVSSACFPTEVCTSNAHNFSTSEHYICCFRAERLYNQFSGKNHSHFVETLCFSHCKYNRFGHHLESGLLFIYIISSVRILNSFI